VLFLERLFTVQYLIKQVNLVVLAWRHMVVSLPYTISGSAVICLKESDLVVTQPGKTSRRLNMVISSMVISILLKRYVSEPEKQHITTMVSYRTECRFFFPPISFQFFNLFFLWNMGMRERLERNVGSEYSFLFIFEFN